jgi:hypothetical protein
VQTSFASAGGGATLAQPHFGDADAGVDEPPPPPVPPKEWAAHHVGKWEELDRGLDAVLAALEGAK